MAQNLVIDPQTKDYVVDATGKPIPSDRVEEQVYIALSIPQDGWLYGDPNQGSKLYTLENVKRTSSIEQEIASFAQDAIERQVISTGQATASQVKNTETTRTGTANTIEVIPAQTQISNQLDFVSV